jgi:hypothetical protein
MEDNAIDVLLRLGDVRNAQAYWDVPDDPSNRYQEEIVMEQTRRMLGVPIYGAWGDVAASALKTLVIAFVALIAWDWFESGDFDPVGVGSNAAVVAISLFVLDALLMRAER